MDIKALDNTIDRTRSNIGDTTGSRAAITADLAEYCFARATKILAKYSIGSTSARVELTGHIMRSYDCFERRRLTWG